MISKPLMCLMFSYFIAILLESKKKKKRRSKMLLFFGPLNFLKVFF